MDPSRVMHIMCGPSIPVSQYPSADRQAKLSRALFRLYQLPIKKKNRSREEEALLNSESIFEISLRKVSMKIEMRSSEHLAEAFSLKRNLSDYFLLVSWKYTLTCTGKACRLPVDC